MLKFLEVKKWKLNSENWPFENIDQFLIVYVDDISVFSPRNIPNDIQIHCNILEFVFFASALYGFKIGRNKFEPFVTKFRYLGHFFDVLRGCTTIPPSKVEIFKNFRDIAI